MDKFRMLWAAGLASSLLVAGCVGDPQRHRASGLQPNLVVITSPCTGNVAPITVNRIQIPASAASASIQVNPGTAVVRRAGDGVHWQLPSGRHEFADDGISFPQGAPVGPSLSAISPNRLDYWWCFDASAPNSTWKYTIKFYDTNSPSKVWSCDPIIVNFDALTAVAPLRVNCI